MHSVVVERKSRLCRMFQRAARHHVDALLVCSPCRWLHDNHLTGTIPPTLGNMKKCIDL
jgi:hypothetical protein